MQVYAFVYNGQLQYKYVQFRKGYYL